MRQCTSAYASPIEVKLSKFVASSGLFVRGTPVSRSAAIWFLRNKRGVAHPHDWEREDDKLVNKLLAETYDPTPMKIGSSTQFVQFTNSGLSEVDQYICNIILDIVNSDDIGKLTTAIEQRYSNHIERSASTNSPKSKDDLANRKRHAKFMRRRKM